MTGIYKITSPDGKIYIGQSTELAKRFRAHRNNSVLKKGVRLLNSFLQHGANNHDFEVLVNCEKDDLNRLERFYQEKYDVLSDNGLNDSLIGFGDIKTVYSDRVKKRKSEQMKGKPSHLRGTQRTDEQKNHHKQYMLNKENSASHRLVFHTELGIYFKNIREAADAFGIKKNTLCNYLSGYRTNKTAMIYA